MISRGCVQVVPTITAAAYSAGNAVGGIQALAPAPAPGINLAKLQSLTLLDKDNQKAALTVLFFTLDPTANGATVTDKSAFAWGTGTAPLLFCGKTDIAAAAYETFNGMAVACVTGLQLPLQVQTNGTKGPTLYAAAVTTGTPTYTTTASLIFTYGFADVEA